MTYDIDANGILNVSARDKDTGAEQAITISQSSNLDQGEVERMVADAEAHRAEDARVRAEVDARNELDAVANQVERRLAELGDQVPVAREGPRREPHRRRPQGRSRSRPRWTGCARLSAELQQVFHGLGASRAAGTGAPPTEPSAADDDDVIDADFTVS